MVECVLSSESEFYWWREYILFRPDMTLRGWLGVKYQVFIDIPMMTYGRDQTTVHK